MMPASKHGSLFGDWILLAVSTTIHTHIHGVVNHARRQPARQEQFGLSALLWDTLPLSQKEPGIELATFRLPVNWLYLLSYSIELGDFD